LSFLSIRTDCHIHSHSTVHGTSKLPNEIQTHQQQIYHKCNKYFKNVTLSLALSHSQSNTRHKPIHNSHGSYKPAPRTMATWTNSTVHHLTSTRTMNTNQPERQRTMKDSVQYQHTSNFHTIHDMPDLETLALLICMYRILDMASARNVSQYLSSVNGPTHGLSTTRITR